MNPYDVLGVPRDADKATIKAAYRARSMTLHPDQGGSVEEFGRLKFAYDVLMDDERRADFDRNGSLDEKPMMGKLDADAIGLIVTFVVQACASFQADPSMVPDFLDQLETKLRENIEACNTSIAAHEKIIARLEKLGKRILPEDSDQPNILGMAIAHHAASILEGLARAKESLKVRLRAIEIIDDYRFEVEYAPNTPAFFVQFMSTTSTTGTY